jgi:hypothetical protein
VGRPTGIAAASVALAIVLLAIGAYSGDEDDTSYFLVASAITIAVAVVLFWGIVPRVTRPGLGGLVIGILAVVSIVVFWLGLPSPLAGAATVLGLAARESGSEAGKGTAALVLAALAVAAAVVLALIG